MNDGIAQEEHLCCHHLFQDSVFCNTTQWVLHHIKYDTYMNNDLTFGLWYYM